MWEFVYRGFHHATIDLFYFWAACFKKQEAWDLIEATFDGLKDGMSEGLWGQISIYDDSRRIYKLKVKKDEYLWLMCAKQGKEKKKQVQKKLSAMIFSDSKWEALRGKRNDNFFPEEEKKITFCTTERLIVQFHDSEL